MRYWIRFNIPGLFSLKSPCRQPEKQVYMDFNSCVGLGLFTRPCFFPGRVCLYLYGKELNNGDKKSNTRCNTTGRGIY